MQVLCMQLYSQQSPRLQESSGCGTEAADALIICLIQHEISQDRLDRQRVRNLQETLAELLGAMVDC